MWVYETAALLASPSAQERLFEFCAPRQITDLFWQTHITRSAKDARYVLQEAEKLRPFLKAAQAHGLRVHALGGDQEDTFAANHPKVLARVDAFLAFNQQSPPDGRFAGLHLDVEPHALRSWKTANDEEKTSLLTQMVELHAKVAAKLRKEAPGTLYGVDIVFWLDKTMPDGTPVYPVTFQGITKDPTQHLLDLVDHVGIMSYRNKAEEKNGIIPLTQRSITSADHARGRAYVGVKMADIGPKNESFFGQSEAAMNAELQKIDEAYRGHRGYAGIAFFMYSAYQRMAKEAR